MRKQLAACGVGLALAVLPGEASHPPLAPERFARYITNDPDACPGGTGQSMPSILLEGDMFARGREQREKISEVDLRMQARICRAAIHIGNRLLNAVNDFDPQNGFAFTVNHQYGRSPTISATRRNADTWSNITATYVIHPNGEASGPASLIGIVGIREVGADTYERTQLSRMRLREGGEVWSADAIQYGGELGKRIILDSAEGVSTMAALEERIDATDTQLALLRDIPLPPPISTVK